MANTEIQNSQRGLTNYSSVFELQYDYMELRKLFYKHGSVRRKILHCDHKSNKKNTEIQEKKICHSWGF